MREAVRLLLALLLTVGACSPAPAPPSGSPGSASVVSPAASPGPTATPEAGRTPASQPPPTPTPVAVTTAPPTPAGSLGPTVTVPVLYHHRVLPLPAGISTWSAANRKGFLETATLPWALAAQLDWLAANGYTTILPRDLAAWWDRAVPLPPKRVIITFDDGYPEWLDTVLPLLQEHRMIAEFYVTVDAIRDGRLTWDKVRTLANAGMGIGAHDVHHVQLAQLGAGRAPASAATMAYEVTEARRIIGEEIGAPPDSMAYVGGGYDATLVGIVRQAGYSSARAIVRGVVQSPASRWTLHVSRIGVWDDVFDRDWCLAAPSVATCGIRVPLATFADRMSGANPG